MSKTVKISRRVARGHVTYIVSLPKAIIELLGRPQRAAVSMEIRDGKAFIILEPLDPEVKR